MKQCRDCQVCSIYVCRTTNTQVFVVRCDQALLSAGETPANGLGRIVQVKIAVQIQTVLALYGQETPRNNGQPRYQMLEASLRLHVDQTMRTRNFRARNDTVERGAITKGRKGKKAYVVTKVGECFQSKAHGQRSKGDLCSFIHESVSGNGYAAERGKGQSSSPAPDTKAKTDGQKP